MNDIYYFDALVVGSGVIGLSTALALQKKGRKVLLIEKNSYIAEETSSRNSGVIHSGIYYPKESLKKSFCIKGNDLLYKFCENNNVPHKKTGKLIVANNDEEDALLAIYQNGINNGLEQLELIDGNKVRDIEPNISKKISAGIIVKSTGIVDQPSLCKKLLELFEEMGGQLTLNTNFDTYKNKDSFHLSSLNTLGEEFKIKSKYLVICSGLHSYETGLKIDEVKNSKSLKKLKFVKGHYFKLNVKRTPFQKLIYPVPNKLGLGVHYTLDLDGCGKFGPDTIPVNNINYAFEGEGLKKKFFEEIIKYFPKIKIDDLTEDYTGIRPKLDSNKKYTDFSILDYDDHKVKNLIFLQGFESPGLTSSMAISEHIVKKLML
tara:strand:+ start:80 stop:1204 length:1125 start_codon:yes stop_codon:yes gene_type:complete